MVCHPSFRGFSWQKHTRGTKHHWRFLGWSSNHRIWPKFESNTCSKNDNGHTPTWFDMPIKWGMYNVFDPCPHVWGLFDVRRSCVAMMPRAISWMWRAIERKATTRRHRSRRGAGAAGALGCFGLQQGGFPVDELLGLEISTIEFKAP